MSYRKFLKEMAKGSLRYEERSKIGRGHHKFKNLDNLIRIEKI